MEGTRPNSGGEYTSVPTATGITGVYTQGSNKTEVIVKPGGVTEYIIRPTEAPVMNVPGSLTGGGYAASLPGSVPG